MCIVDRPVTVKENTSRNASAVEVNNDATDTPFGSRTVTSTCGYVLFDSVNVNFCPAVPGNVRIAFSPITVVVTVVDDPIAVVPRLSGTDRRRKVSDPVNVDRGSIVIVYVPVSGRVD